MYFESGPRHIVSDRTRDTPAIEHEIPPVPQAVHIVAANNPSPTSCTHIYTCYIPVARLERTQTNKNNGWPDAGSKYSRTAVVSNDTPKKSSACMACSRRPETTCTVVQCTSKIFIMQQSRWFGLYSSLSCKRPEAEKWKPPFGAHAVDALSTLQRFRGGEANQNLGITQHFAHEQ